MPPDGLSTGAKVALGGAAAGTVLLVLILIGYFVWVRPGDTSVVAEPPSSPSEPAGSPGAEEPQDGQDPEDPPEDPDSDADAPQDPGTPPDLPDFETQEFSGTGRTSVDIEVGEEPNILSVSQEGTGGISVWAVDSEAERQWEVLRRGSGYEGRLLFNTTSSLHSYDGLKIVTDGDWEVSLEPLSTADHWEAGEAEYGGSGDDVVQLLWSPDNFSTLAVAHEGPEHFSVRAYDNFSASTLISETGDHEGEFRLTPRTVLVAVESQGDWTITR